MNADVFIAVVHQSHQALKIVDVTLQALPWLNSDREEMVVVPLKISPRSELIIEGVSYIIESLKRVLRE